MKPKLPPFIYRRLLSLLVAVSYTLGSGALSEEIAPAAAEPLIWAGNEDGSWTVQGEASSSPWQGSAEYVNGNSVIFNDSGTLGKVFLTGIIAPGQIKVDADTTKQDSYLSSTGSEEFGDFKYGYAFVGSGKIADYTDADGNIIQQTSIVNEGSSILILNTANTFSGGVVLGAGSSLYLACDNAAGTGAIDLSADNTTLVVNYFSEDMDFRTPSVTNTLLVSGDTKITSGVAGFGEFESENKNRLSADWRMLTLSGGISGSGELSLYGYSYLVKPTTEAEKEITFNYVSAIAVNEQNAVTVDGATPDRFTGTVYLKNEFNYRPSGTLEVNTKHNNHVGGAMQLTLVDDVFSEATLDLTRDYNKDRQAGHNANKGGKSGYGLTSDNILVLSESSQITIKALEATFRGSGFLYNHTTNGNYDLVSSYMEGNYGQLNERWNVRVVTDGYTNLVLNDNSDAVHVFSGSMGFEHSYVTSGQAYVHAPSVVDIKGNITNLKPSEIIVAPEPTNPGAGSLGVAQLSLEKRGASTQYIHTAKLVNLSVLDGVLGFNNLAVSDSLKIAGNSTLRLGVAETLADGTVWVTIDATKAQNQVNGQYATVDEALRTNRVLTVGAGYLEVSSTKQPGRGTLPTTSRIEGGLDLTGSDASGGITFNINSVMPVTGADYAHTLLDVTDTLTLWNSADITLNFSNINLSTQYDSTLTYYLASANDIVVKSNPNYADAFINGRTVTLGSGYYGSLKVITEGGRDYLVMNVVGDPRRTWSGMLSAETPTPNYIWQHTTKQNVDDPDIADSRWKENRNYENGLLVLFGNLYQPIAWDGVSALDSSQTVNVSSTLHAGNWVQAGESGFAIDGVNDAVVGYQKVQIVGEVAPASIVIGSDFNLNGVNTGDATNYYFYSTDNLSFIRDAKEGELHEAFKGSVTGLRKIGDGTAVIATDNRYTGGTVIEGGRIVMQHKNALGTGEAYIVNGAVLQADFADNCAEFSDYHAFSGEQMGTTVVVNPVRTSIYVDPSNPDYTESVNARISNAHNKKMVLTYLSGSVDTVVTLYGNSQKSGQYSYAVFKVLNPTAFSGTVRMDGNLTGNDVFNDLWDDDTTDNYAGGNVQMEIMTIDKAKDTNGGNWLNANIDLSVENGTNRTVLALDALGTSDAEPVQIAQVNALHGSGNGGAEINSSVLSMSENKTITLQILGTVKGNYDGVLGYGDFQKTVDYSANPNLLEIGMVHHHYGRTASAGALNVQKDGNVTQSVNSAWLDTLQVNNGYFVVDESLVVRSIITADSKHLVIGSVDQAAHPHSLVVGKGGILAIDSDSSVDAFAGIGAGIPKRREEIVEDDGDISSIEVAPEKFILFANGATITAFNDWMTNATRKETVNGELLDIPVTIDIDHGATVTFNTHNYTPDASISDSNDVFGRYNRSHVIQLLGKMTGNNVNLIFNNELISAAANPSLREDGLGYTGEVGSELGYVLIRNHNELTGDISVLSNTVLQVLEGGSAADMDVLVDGKNASMQMVDSADTQYLDSIVLRSGGALLLGGNKRTSLPTGENKLTELDYEEENVRVSVTNRYEKQDGRMTTLNTELSGGVTAMGGSDAAPAAVEKVHVTAYSAGTHELYDADVTSSLLELKEATSLDITNDVRIDYNSMVMGTPSNGLSGVLGPSVDVSDIKPTAASETLYTGVNTTIELTAHSGEVLRSPSATGSVLVYHAYISQLQDVDVEGEGVSFRLVDSSIIHAAQVYGADFVALQITGEGQFRYEESLGSLGFSGDNWFMYDADGQLLNEVWYTSTQIEEQFGVKVSSGMLYLAVPEPTTATLSLVALAALAVRRRRR